MPQLSAVRDDILAYYALGKEDARLRQGSGRLELWRTRDVLRRLLPAAPARVLDVGGGSGVHAEWLARDGRRVEEIPSIRPFVGARATSPLEP